MTGASGVRLEPELVGEQHKEIVKALMGRFQIDPDTGRWALRPGRGGLVVLSGPSGAGKSRIVREVYRGLLAGQSEPGYWPELAPTGGATVADGPDGGLAVFGFRKSVGPDSAGFVWPAHSVPDYLWWQVACQAASTGGFVDAQALFANELLRHQEPGRFGWARAAGGRRWAARAKKLLPLAGGAVVDEGKNEAVGALLAEAAGQVVPFGGLVTRSLQALTGAAIRAADRQERLTSDTELGVVTGGQDNPTDTLAAVVASLALPGFPVIVAVEDLHEADAATLELLGRLAGPGYADRVLVIATAWPEALASRTVGDASLGDWLGSQGAQTVGVAQLDGHAVADLVWGQFPGTAPEGVAAIAQRWSNPLAVALVLDLLVGDGAIIGDAISADDKQIDEIPSDLAGLYDQQFARLPLGARKAVILDVICGADAVTAGDFGRAPGPESTWNPVDPSRVLVAVERQGIEPAGFDHAAAVDLGWLMSEQDWLAPREPGLAQAAWRAIRGHRLRGPAPQVRAEVARLLADMITQAARTSEGTPGLFIRGDRWWLRESAWMVSLAANLADEPNVQAAAARAAFELFHFEAQLRPQEALRDWAPWATAWETLLGPDHPDTFVSRIQLAGAYASAGDLPRAIQLLEQTHADMERVLGVDHPDTLAAANNLAATYRAAGDVARAIQLLEQTHADMERVLGVDHPVTLSAANNLAATYRAAGDVARAIQLLEQTHADMERVLGVDHPDTLSAANNLAVSHRAAGDLARAIQLLEQTHAELQRVLGVDHPDTLSSRVNLAGAYGAAGDLARAIQLLEQTHAELQRVLGVDHPGTLAAASNLAGAYLAAGDLARAIPLLEQTLADMERVLDADHPDVLSARVNLASAYRTAGDVARATPLLERTLVDMQRVLGVDHPDTLTAGNHLAGAYRSAGDLSRAIQVFEQTLTDRLRVLGADHPGTLSVRVDLAATCAAAGDVGRAIPMLEQTLAEMQRLLGENHTDTMSARIHLAGAYMSAGHLGRAIALYEQTLADRRRVLGGDHPDTMSARINLAVAYRLAGDLGRAIPLLEQALSEIRGILGVDHPDTLTARNNLAVAYMSAGDLGRAIPLLEQTLADRRRLLGGDHPDSMTAGNNLAAAYQSVGDLGRAILLLEQTMSGMRRVLGADHPDTLTAVSNLAVAYGSAGDVDRAIPLLEQALLERQRVQGPDHQATLSASLNLALAYESAGDLGRAVALLEQTLADRLRVLGVDHPDTTAVRQALMRARRHIPQ